jgi:hypothetical protein
MLRVVATLESSARLKLVLYAALLAAACALSLVPARAGQRVPPVSSMLAGAVTYTLPAGWQISMYINTPGVGGAQITHTEKASGQPQGPLYMSARLVPKEKVVGDMINDTFGSDLRKKNGGTVLSDESDGEDWRTVVWTEVQSGKTYLLLEHFGVVNGKFAGLTASVSLDSGDVKWMKQAVTDFNAMCESLKIDGKGSFEKKISPDIITEQLKVKK